MPYSKCPRCGRQRFHRNKRCRAKYCSVCYTAHGQGSVNNIRLGFWKRLEAQAKRRGKKFDVDIEYGGQLLKQQGERCALTGLMINANSNRDLITASLDRINNDKDYIKGNVQWVHKAINMMRGSLTVIEFVSLCALVAKECSDDRRTGRSDSN